MAQTDDTLLKVEHLVDVVIGKPLAHFGISAKGKTLSLQKSLYPVGISFEVLMQYAFCMRQGAACPLSTYSRCSGLPLQNREGLLPVTKVCIACLGKCTFGTWCSSIRPFHCTIVDTLVHIEISACHMLAMFKSKSYGLQFMPAVLAHRDKILTVGGNSGKQKKRTSRSW